MSVVVEWTPQYSRNRRNQGAPCTTDFSSGQREAAHTHTHTHAGRVRELRVVLMLQQRPDPRRTRLEELLADGTVARLALNLGELFGDEKDSDARTIGWWPTFSYETLYTHNPPRTSAPAKAKQKKGLAEASSIGRPRRERTGGGRAARRQRRLIGGKASWRRRLRLRRPPQSVLRRHIFPYLWNKHRLVPRSLVGGSPACFRCCVGAL